MPQDPNLYGQRPAKRQKKEIPLSSSLDFASQLTSLLSTSASDPASASSTVAAGRARPSKNKDDIFSVRAKRKAGSAAAASAADGDAKDGKGSRGRDRDRDGAKISLKETRGTEEEKQDLARARRRMEEKARLYAAMKRGDYIAKEGEAAPLVDFDRKWAEKHPEEGDPNNNNYSSSGTDNDSDSEDGAGGKEEEEEELIEFKDEFGRTRRATRAEIARLQRRRQRVELGTAELEAMSAKPSRAPANLIFGDVVQAAAFDPEDATYARMEDLASKRDREPTPPPDAHFDGGAEIRTKGVGFYRFSRDEDRRAAEMRDLAQERDNTERVRREREEAREKRRREIEDRRARIGAKRAEKMADSFLDGLAEKWGAGAGAASGPGGKDKGGADDGGKEKEKGVADEKASS